MGKEEEAAPAANVVAEETPVGEIVQDPNEAPDGGYGWVCVACAFTIGAFTWGLASSYGVFLAHYLNSHTFPGATALDFAFIGGIQFGMALSIATPLTILIRILHGNVHIPMVAGALIQSCGFILASFATSLWQLYLTQGVLVGLGLGMAFLPVVPIASQWFVKKRSLTNGIVSAGSGTGGLAWSFATQAMLARLSAAWALRVIGVVAGAANLAAIAFVRSRNRQVRPTLRGFDARLLRRQRVLLLLAWAFVSNLGFMTLLYSLSAYAKEIGLSDAQASAITAILNLGTAVGRPCVGLLSDRYGRVEVAGITTFACTVFVFALWIPARSFGLLAVFALLSGATLGTWWMLTLANKTVGPLSVEAAGLKNLNSLLALSYGVIVLPTTFSEVIALQIRRPGSSWPYLYPQLYSGFTYLISSAILLRLWQIQRRKHVAASAPSQSSA